MTDYYQLFIDLCLQQCTKDDFADPQQIKAHNLAINKLYKLQSEMKKTDCKGILKMLLSHEDDRVRINSAAMCLQESILADDAILTLRQVVNTSKDSILSFSAEMLLKKICFTNWFEERIRG